LFWQWIFYQLLCGNIFLISDTTGPIFTKFKVGRPMEGLDKSCIHFAIDQGTLPWQPSLDVKSATLANLPLLVALAFQS